MAAETPVTISLQARDWEQIVGVITSQTDAGLRRLATLLQTAYSIATPPQGATLVPITTKERVLIKIYELFHDPFTQAMFSLSNNAPRIVNAIKAANNVADNYINTETARVDAQLATYRDAQTIANRKAGRAFLLIDVIDNN